MTFDIERLENRHVKFENEYYRIEVYYFENMLRASVKPKHVQVALSVVNDIFCVKLQDIGTSVITAESLEKLIPSLVIAKDACKELNRLVADGILDKYNVKTICFDWKNVKPMCDE